MTKKYQGRNADLYEYIEDRLVIIGKLTREQAQEAIEKFGWEEAGVHFSAGSFDAKDYAHTIAERYRREHLNQRV